MDRSETEAIVRKMYACRLDNNLDDCVACFAPLAVYELCGSSDTSPIPSRCEGDHDAMREILAGLIDTWRWKDIAYSSFVIDGDQVVVRYHLTTEFAPLQKTVTTEIIDHLIVRDGKIVSLSEFVDTAMVAELVQRAESKS